MIKELEEGRYLTQHGLTIAEQRAETDLGQAYQNIIAIAKLPDVLIPAISVSGLSLIFKENAAEIMEVYGLKAFLYVASLRGFSMAFEKKAGFGEVVRYFDTKPKNERTSPNDEVRASQFKSLYMRAFAFSAIGMTLGASKLLEQGVQNVASLDLFLTNSFVASVTGAAAYRFYRVENHDWALLGGTPKQKTKLSGDLKPA